MIKWIADVGSNHNGIFGRAERFIEISKEIGCWGVKFQIFSANKLWEKKETIKKMIEWEFDRSWIKKLHRLAKTEEISIGYTPFDKKAVSEISGMVDFLKVGSYEILFHDLLRCISSTQCPNIILSTGMATIEEISTAINILHSEERTLSLLHCCSEYPASSEKTHMLAIPTYKRLFELPVGWSDHTGQPGVMFAAMTAGADIIEFHLDLDKRGNEYSIGHCWLPQKIRDVIKQEESFHRALQVMPFSDKILEEYQDVIQLRKQRTNKFGKRKDEGEKE